MRTNIAIGFVALTLLIPALSLAQDTGTPQGGYCPHITQNLKRGDRDATTIPPGQVTELQKFLVDYYDLNPDTYISGYFGRLTQQNVIRFQQEQNITPASGFVGPLTRAAIARVCAQTTTPPPANPPPQNPAPTCALSASPSSITLGQSSTLSWTSTNATQGYVSSIGTVTTNGSQSVSPLLTAIYQGIFWGTGGTATCNATLTVTQPTTNNNPPPICTPDPTSPQTQTLSCPAGQTGSIIQTRTSTCATGATSPTWGPWVTTGNTCVTPVASAITCTMAQGTTAVSLSCPADLDSNLVGIPANCHLYFTVTHDQVFLTNYHNLPGNPYAYRGALCTRSVPGGAFSSCLFTSSVANEDPNAKTSCLQNF